jgi:hypothetical protein
MSQTLEQPSTDPTHSLPQDELDASTAELNRESNQRTIHKLLGMIPSIFVFASLAGLGFYGHHNDWKLPSSLAGESQLPLVRCGVRVTAFLRTNELPARPDWLKKLPF